MIFFRRKPKRIGLALGGGGARGLAHIQVLEALDELGVRPHRIAGTSIGAVMGALYASGLTGKQIRGMVNDLLFRQADKPARRQGRNALRWIEFMDPGFHHGGLLKGEKFIRFLSESMQCDRFEDLKIPLQVSTTDYRTGAEAVFSSGDLLSAVRASMAIPGIFTPVEHGGKLLADGGLVNPLPCSLLRPECDFIIAVDVSGSLDQDAQPPAFFDAVFAAFDIIHAALIREQLRNAPPDLYLKPALHGIRILEFNKAERIFEQSASVKDELRRRLKR